MQPQLLPGSLCSRASGTERSAASLCLLHHDPQPQRPDHNGEGAQVGRPRRGWPCHRRRGGRSRRLLSPSRTGRTFLVQQLPHHVGPCRGRGILSGNKRDRRGGDGKDSSLPAHSAAGIILSINSLFKTLPVVGSGYRSCAPPFTILTSTEDSVCVTGTPFPTGRATCRAV